VQLVYPTPLPTSQVGNFITGEERCEVKTECSDRLPLLVVWGFGRRGGDDDFVDDFQHFRGLDPAVRGESGCLARGSGFLQNTASAR